MEKKSGIDIFTAHEARTPVIVREVLLLERGVSTGIGLTDEALALWWSLYDESGSTPLWSAFQPFRYPALLPHAVTYEKKEGRFRCGLMGETVREELHFKLAGNFVDDAMPEHNVPDALFRFNASLESGMPNVAVKTMAWSPGRESSIYATLQMPFIGRDGVPTRVMCVMAFNVEG